MVVGNLVTVAMELLAIGLAVALVRPWGRRVPAWVVLVLGGGATGLLAPILLGLPIGVLAQLLLRQSVSTGGEGDLASWVFALVYTGFGLQGVALVVLLGRYVLARWHRLVEVSPRRPAGWALVVGALGLLPFGLAMVWWGLLGAGTAGPQGMESPVQRVFLLVTGVLVLLALVAPLVSAGRPRLTWLAVWVGCTVAALQGPTQLLLARDGEPQPAVVLLALVATPTACAYGLAILRDRCARADRAVAA